MSFSIKSLGHYVAVVSHDIVKYGAVAQKALPLVEAVTAIEFPPALAIERASASALGYVLDAAQNVDNVSNGAPITITLAAQELQDFKDLAAFFRQHAAANGLQLPAKS